MADGDLFDIFDFTWLAGDPETALDGPHDVVLTQGAARRHFGDTDPLGQTLLLGGGAGDWESLRVTGVIEDLPDNTTLAFDVLQSMKNNVEGEQWETLRRQWLEHPGITHVTRSDRAPFEPNGRTAEIRGTDPTRPVRRMPFLTVD